jgi:SAM-dependent methyltransferases related to tRNA (uracil-5-)-methyltransferase
MNDLLAVLAKIIEQGSFNGINEIIIRQNRAHDQLLLALVGKLSHDEQQRLVGESAAITASFPLCGIVYRNPATRTGKTLWGSNAIQDTIAGLTFSYGVESFFQINPAMAEKLIADLRVSLPLTAQSRIADLFCGVGLFGIILAPDVKQVSFIEADLDNAGFLKQNIRANHITNGTVQTGDCERWTRKPAHAHYDAVIVDPPRRGLGKTFCTALIKNAPGYIAYVSCDPATLARDCKDLLPAYEPQRLQAYDFFPQTPHIETLTILKKR